jgi:Ca2+-binding RTX toxin-like protein
MDPAKGAAMRRHSLGAAFAMIVCGSIVLPTLNAAAAITTSVDAAGVLTISGDAANDRVVVRCSDAGNVLINGADPGTGAVACTDITTITVSLADGSDFANIRYVTADVFTSLTSVSLALGPGDDYGESRVWPTTMVDAGGGDQDTAAILTERDVALSEDTSDAATAVVLAGVEHVAVRGSSGPETIDARQISVDLFEVLGRKGDDTVFGGASRSSNLSGEGGDDRLVGGGGADTLIGGAGADVALGGEGNDSFQDSRGADRSSGGPGRDLFDLPIGAGNVYAGGPGRDAIAARFVLRVTLTDRRLVASGRALLRSVEIGNLQADGGPIRVDASRFSGDVLVAGSAADDVLIGGSGDDDLVGSDGDDSLVGGPGDDRLDGGPGNDTCSGGTGRNLFASC